LEWISRNESGIDGFNLYRSPTLAEHGVQLNASLVLPSAPPDGGWHNFWLDTETAPGQTAYYWLEVVQPD
jgi:hypothetical protein